MKKFSGSAIQRQQVFTLADGTYVVQWEDKRVQELLTGNFRPFDFKGDFGHPITDYELKQLRSSGRVEHFNRNYIWLYPLPETGRFAERKVLGRGNKIRAYYLSTTTPKSELGAIQHTLRQAGLDEHFWARAREEVVVILGKNGVPFRTFDDAESAQNRLRRHTDFMNLTIAFVEVSGRLKLPTENSNSSPKLSLDDIIASQSDTSRIGGKRVVLAVRQEDERQVFGKLFAEMQLEVLFASSAAEALQLLEDHPADLFITDVQLPDMHVWNMLSKVKEIESLRELPIMVITDQPNFAVTVAKVDYMQRPISIARLRHNVWVALTDTNHTDTITPPGSESS